VDRANDDKAASETTGGTKPDGPVASGPSASEPGDKDGKAPGTATSIQKVVSSLPVDHRGTTLHLKGWRLEHSKQHPVVIIHDLGERADLYKRTALSFVERGYSTYAFDLRGHGRSGRRLGHAPGFTILVKDLLQVCAWVRHKEGGREPLILGHGIGALIALEFTKRYGQFCRAAILSAPSLELATDVSLIGRWTLRALAEVSPTFRIPSALCPRFAKDLRGDRPPPKETEEGLDGGDGSGDDTTGPLYFPRLTAVFAHQILMAIERAEARFAAYSGDVLILCPGEDAINLYGRMRKTAALHSEHNLEIADLPGISHYVFTGGEPAREAALAVIFPWLARVLAGARRGPAAATEAERLEGASAAVRPPDVKPGASRE
jgi:alpha-beta hydrolase superfamily lysophospholipase